MKKKALTVRWWVCLVIAAAWVCQPDQAAFARRDKETGKVLLKLWNASPARTREGRRPGPNTAEIFKQQNPEIAIEGATELSIEGAESSKLLAIAGDTAPDVFDEFGRTLQNFASQGFLCPLDDYLADYEARHGKPYEGIWSPAPVWETAKYKGKIYGIPRSFYTMQLFWRKDFLRKAQLDENIAPKNWDELFKICMAVTEHGTQEIVIGGKRIKDNRFGIALTDASWTFLSFFWAAGGEVVRPYIKTKSGEEVELPRERCDFHKEHIHLRGDEAYYNQPSVPSNFSKTGEEVKPRIKGQEGDDVIWKLVVNEPASLKALNFFWKLMHQPWVRVEDEHGRRELEVTKEMLATGVVQDPSYPATFSLQDLKRQNRYYEGVAWKHDEKVDPPLSKLFAQGRVAMLISHTWSATDFVGEGLDKQLVGTGPLPAGPGGEKASWIGAGYYAINAMTDKESQDAAWRYLEFITANEDMAKLFMQYSVMEGTALFDWPSKLVKFGYTDILREVPKHWIEAETEILRTARAEPYCPGFQTVYSDLDMILEKILHDSSPTLEEAAINIKKIAGGICEHVNTRKLGKPPEKELARMRWVTRGLFLALAVVFFYYTYRALSTLAQRTSTKVAGGVTAVQSVSAQRRQLFYACGFLSIAVLSVLLWSYIPLAQGSLMAFYDWKLKSTRTFVGLENFTEILYNREFYLTMLRTLYYVVLSIGMGFLAPVMLALMLHEVPRGKMLYRTLYYIPAVTTGLVTMFLWKQILYEPSAHGLLNQMYLLCAKAVVELVNGLSGAAVMVMPEPLKWLKSPNLAMACVILPSIWAGAGPACLVYLAALKSIPEDHYEAADLDGASVWHKIIHITLPSLSALLIINFIGSVIGSFYAMQNIFVMTAGGPLNATHVIGIDIWFNAFLYLRFGYAVAMAWILASLLIGFTVYQLQLINKVEFRAHGTAGG